MMAKSKKNFKFDFKIEKLSESDILQYKNFSLYEKEICDIHKDKNKKLFLEACEDGNLKKIKEIFKKSKIDINYRNNSNKTGLIYASKNGHINIVKFLVENGADLNIQDINNNTALMFAIFYNNTEIAQYLITQGSDLSLRNIHGSILHVAVCVDNLVIIDELYNRGCDLNDKDNNKNTCIFIATINKNYNIVKYLIKKSVDLNLVNNNLVKYKSNEYRENLSLLHICIRDDLIELLILFIKNKINLHIKNDNLETPLQYACKLNKITFVKLLLQSGANPNITSILNYSCLHCAIDNNNLEMIKLLIEYNADYNLKTLNYSIHTKSREDESILAYAKRQLNYNIINYLDSKNAIYYCCY